MKKPLLAVAITSLFSFSGLATAAPISQQAGFSGFISVLPAGIDTRGNLHTGSDNRVLESLDSDGNRERRGTVAALGMLRYTLTPGRDELYFGTPPERVGEGSFQLELGYRHQLNDGSRLRLGLIPFELLESRVWQDPFMVDERRERSSASNRGLRLGWSAIAASDWSVDYTWIRHRVRREHSGEFLALAAADRHALRRDADHHRLTVDYRYRLSRSWTLTPSYRYERIDAEGRAERANVHRPQLNALWRNGPHQLSLTGYAAFSRYAGVNPVFGEKRDANGWGLVAGYSYAEPFGWKNGRVDVFGLTTRSDADIRFYDQRTSVLAVGVGYRFQ